MCSLTPYVMQRSCSNKTGGASFFYIVDSASSQHLRQLLSTACVSLSPLKLLTCLHWSWLPSRELCNSCSASIVYSHHRAFHPLLDCLLIQSVLCSCLSRHSACNAHFLSKGSHCPHSCSLLLIAAHCCSLMLAAAHSCSCWLTGIRPLARAHPG